MGAFYEREQQMRSLPQEQRRNPDPADVERFTKVCLAIKDPNQITMEEALAFDKVGAKLSEGGWALSQTVGLYWSLRPDYQRLVIDGKPVTPEFFADAVIWDYEQEQAAEARTGVSNPLMEPEPQLREFQRAMIQHAAVTGAQVVYRVQRGSIREDLEEFGLPAHIPPASRRRPSYPER